MNTTTDGGQFSPTATPLDDGGFLIAWQANSPDGNSIYAQRFDQAGSTEGGEFVVHTERVDAAAASLATTASGDVVAVWPETDTTPFADTRLGVLGRVYDWDFV